MDKKEEQKLLYKNEGLRRMHLRKEKRIDKIYQKEKARQDRRLNCCEGNSSCNGTTDCMWY